MRNGPIIYLNLVFCMLMMGPIASGFSVEEKVTIMGVVNEHYQILSDDNHLYTLGNGEQDGALVGAVGKRVVIIGIVTEYEGQKTISELRILGPRNIGTGNSIKK